MAVNSGILYGIGVGPGDPDLLTLKGAALLAHCLRVFVPRGRERAESLALEIATRHLHPEAVVTELLFPMTTDKAKLAEHWQDAARTVLETLQQGHNAVFLTLGDPMLYSTFIYLARALRTLCPEAPVQTVAGVTAFSAAAAAATSAVGEAKRPVVIVPTADDLTTVRQALEMSANIVLMKISHRLPEIVKLLEEYRALDRAVLVSRVGLSGEQIATDLRALVDQPRAGYLSVILVPAAEEEQA